MAHHSSYRNVSLVGSFSSYALGRTMDNDEKRRSAQRKRVKAYQRKNKKRR